MPQTLGEVLTIHHFYNDLDVYENSGTPKSSLFIGFSIINHPFWGTPIFGNTQFGGVISSFWYGPQKRYCIHVKIPIY